MANDRVVERLIINIAKGGEQYHNLEDLAQDIYVDLMNKPDDLIAELYKKDEISYYVARMISNNIYSKSSPYYKRYKKLSLISDSYDQTH